MTLIEKLQAATGPDNALDVAVEVALFQPDETCRSCHTNSAGTKVVYRRHNNSELVCWAWDWTSDRAGTVAALQARGIE